MKLPEQGQHFGRIPRVNLPLFKRPSGTARGRFLV